MSKRKRTSEPQEDISNNKKSTTSTSKPDITRVVEKVNAIPPSDFFKDYLDATTNSSFKALKQRCSELQPPLTISLHSPSDNDQRYLDKCLALIEHTSSDDYQRSEKGWSRSKKRREMKLPDLRYVVLSSDKTTVGDFLSNVVAKRSNEVVVEGFASFMITYEDGQPVLYVYEIHFTSQCRGKGLGRLMMQVMEKVGRKVGVKKIMLTVFRCNSEAVRFYERLEYAEDEYSPGSRVLRNGTVKEPSYLILSKSLLPNTDIDRKSNNETPSD